MTIKQSAACLVVLSGTVATAPVLRSAGETGSEQARIVRREQPPRVIAGSAGRLGISIRDVEDEDLKRGRLSAQAGAVVDRVSEGSAAEKAGLRVDDIIVEFDGERVRSARQLTRLVQETPEGRKVPTVVVRAGERLTIAVEPGRGSGVFENLRELEDWGRNFAYSVPPHPPSPPTARGRTTPGNPWRFDDLFHGGSSRLGMTVDDLSEQLAEYFGTKDGVLVTSVQDNSAAAKAGIRAGDVITQFNGAAIDDPSDLRRRLQALDAGEEFTVAVMRDKKPQTLKGKLGETVSRRSYRSLI
jgi:S1-C subfamily serine protease